MPDRPTHDVFIVDAVRTPIGAVHGALAEIHPVRLLAAVMETVVQRLERDGIRLDSPNVFCGCADQIGAQAGNIARAAMSTIGMVETSVPVMVSSGELSGHAAFDAAVDAVASGRVTSAMAAGVGHASMVAPGASLRGREHGRPWDGLPAPTATGAACDELARLADISTEKQVAWVHRMRDRSRTSDERQVSSEHQLLGRLPLNDDEPAVASPTSGTGIGMFDDDGTVTAECWAPMGDGAAAILVSADPGPRSVRVATRMSATGEDLPTAIHAVTGAIASAPNVVAIDSQTAVIDLYVMQQLGLDPAATNPCGSGLVTGRPPGIGGLMASADIVRHSRETGSGATMLSVAATGDIAITTIEAVQR